MVRGFGSINPIWDLAIRQGQIDVGNIQGADFSGVGNDIVKNFQSGLEFGNKQLGNRKAAETLKGIAGSSTSPAAVLMGLGASDGPYGGTGTDKIATGFNARSVPTFAQGGAGSEAKTMPSGTFWSPENRQAIIEEATAAGLNPEHLATVMSYETGGTMNPWQKGPTTKWGQHRGLIQWGEPQRQQYGVTPDMPFRDQVKASIKYLQDRGLKPGMGMLEMYSAINAGGISPEHFGRSDTAAGGAPGTVADKVNNQMGGHRRRVQAWLGQGAGMPAPGQVVQPAPSPQTVTQAQPNGGTITRPSPVPAQGQPSNVREQAAQVLQAPDEYDPRTVQWAQGIVGQQQTQQTAAAPQLAPSPNDREIAAEVTRNQVETAKQAQAPKPPTFMGLSINPADPIMGAQGQDILMGGSGAGAATPSAPPVQPAAAAAMPPAAAAPAPGPAPVPRQAAAPYRAPVQAGPAGLDPRYLEAMAYAINGGDPTAVSGVSNAMQLAQPRGGKGGNISLEQLPDGSVVLFNADTGEVSPYMQGGQANSAKAPTIQNINGVDHQWTPGQGWVPLGNAQAKAPETIEQGGVRYQWNAQQGRWTPAVEGTQAVQGGLETISPENVERRRAMGIPDSDKRIYQRNPVNNELKPIAEQRAVDDKAFTQEHQLYQDFENAPVTRKYRGLEQGVQGLAGAFSQGNAAGDMVGVIQLFKAIDPESTVSAGEQATPSNAAGVPESLRRLYNKAVGEGGTFSPQLRADMFNTTRALFINQRSQVERMAKQTIERARRYGLNPENVVDFNPPNFEKATADLFPDRPVAPAAPAAPQVQVVPQGFGGVPGLPAPGGQPEIKVRRLSD
jgi:hypothetical protein